MAEERKKCVFSVISTEARKERLNQYDTDLSSGKKDLYSLLSEGYNAYIKELEDNITNAPEAEKDEKKEILRKAQDEGFSGYVRKEKGYLEEALKSENKGRREASYEGFVDDIRGRLSNLDANEKKSDEGAEAQKDQGVAQKAYKDKMNTLDSWLENGTLNEVDYETQKAEAQARLEAEMTRLEAIVDDGAAARLEILDNNPNDILEDMEKFTDMPQTTQESLDKYRQDCIAAGEEEKFNQVIREYLNSKYQPEYETEAVGKDKKIVRKKGKDANGMDCDIIKNECKFERRIDKDGKAHHVLNIYNLSGTGLNISWIDDKLGFTALPEYITEEQAKALAQYCFDTGIDFDNYNDLTKLNVVDKDGKPLEENGEPISAADRIQEEMKKLLGLEDMQKASFSCRQPETLADENGEPVSFSQFLEFKTPKDPSIRGLEAGAVTSLGGLGYHTSNQLRTSHFGNKTIISVYLNEDDMREDGKLDANRNRKRTKQFAVTIEAGPPASGSIYMPAGKEFKANHARVLLDAFRAQGYKYVSIPGAFDASKPIRGAFLQACAKTLMIPAYNKDDKNSVLYEKDLETIFKQLDEEVKDEPTKYLGNGKAEFYMRLAVEVERQVRDGKTVPSKGLDKLRVRANFENFNLSYQSSLINFINAHYEGRAKGDEKWNDADYIASIRAMAHVIEDISNGRIGDKPYNPLNDGTIDGKLKEAFVFYMAKEKPKVIEEVGDLLGRIESDKGLESKRAQALNTAFTNAEKELTRITKIVTATGCEVKVDMVKTRLGSDFIVEDIYAKDPKTGKYTAKNVSLPEFSNPQHKEAARRGKTEAMKGNSTLQKPLGREGNTH